MQAVEGMPVMADSERRKNGMLQEYDRFSLTDKENFARIVNLLLSHTFLLVEEYDFREGISRVNKDYLFVERNYELFRQYFEMAGFGLSRDSHYGVISLSSRFDGTRVRLDKLSTIMVYALRLIYEEGRENLTLTKEVILTTGDLVHKLINLGAVKKKPSANKEVQKQVNIKRKIDEILYKYDINSKSTAVVTSDILEKAKLYLAWFQFLIGISNMNYIVSVNF